HPRWHRDGNGRLTIWDFRFTMTVDCEDGAGNTTVETVTPEFRKHKKSVPPYTRDIGSFQVS
ncbi:MAG: hypothetical protein GY926_26330, partial [bacterium]|nr:hypothetical protein [bacterium]